jgi:molybdate transport system substrate-binding protein
MSLVRRWVAALAVAMTAAASSPAGAADGRVLVFAAASLKGALDAAVEAWEESSGGSATISYAGSGALAKQLERGAPVDIFLSANERWMDHLAEQGIIDETTRTDLLGNRLVIVAPADSKAALRISPGFDLASSLGDGRLAMANTDAVPAGVYGRTGLTSLGVWDAVRERVAQAQDVRGALALVARGEAPLGIVYRTDALAEPKVRIVDTFPEDGHEPIVYPIALMKASESDPARSLLDFLTSSEAASFFETAGFTVLRR